MNCGRPGDVGVPSEIKDKCNPHANVASCNVHNSQQQQHRQAPETQKAKNSFSSPPTSSSSMEAIASAALTNVPQPYTAPTSRPSVVHHHQPGFYRSQVRPTSHNASSMSSSDTAVRFHNASGPPPAVQPTTRCGQRSFPRTCTDPLWKQLTMSHSQSASQMCGSPHPAP